MRCTTSRDQRRNLLRVEFEIPEETLRDLSPIAMAYIHEFNRIGATRPVEEIARIVWFLARELSGPQRRRQPRESQYDGVMTAAVYSTMMIGSWQMPFAPVAPSPRTYVPPDPPAPPPPKVTKRYRLRKLQVD